MDDTLFKYWQADSILRPRAPALTLFLFLSHRSLVPRKIRVNSLNPGMVETEGLRASGLSEGAFREQQEGNSSGTSRSTERHCSSGGFPRKR